MTSYPITIQDTSSSVVTGQGGQSLITGVPTLGSTALYTVCTFDSYSNSFSAVISGIWTGTINCEASFDGGQTYTSYDALLVGSNTTLSSITENCILKGNAALADNIRFRAVEPITGTANILINSGIGSDFSHTEIDASGISIAEVSIDQATPGTTNGVVVNSGTLSLVQEQSITTGFTDLVTVTSSAQQLPSHVITVGAFLQNSSSATMYVGFNNSVTTANGYPIAANGGQLPVFTANTNSYYVIGISGTLNIIGA